MRSVRNAVECSNGSVRFIPFAGLSEVWGALADTVPLDRSLATAPRWSRRARPGPAWRSSTVRSRIETATPWFTVSETPWVPALVARTQSARLCRSLRWYPIPVTNAATRRACASLRDGSGFRVAGTAIVGGQAVSILVRD